ncbi:histone deacetylase 4 isoform X3 [Ischnura elegans]|uniref:histone deacetylase 4 isoform X3 n=1 Tax=Ischnura elegans TaxID=197161 RepID=UPI001ED8920F|nr:histone deacetylase 4 isoform X3 [Ischnura elegans]
MLVAIPELPEQQQQPAPPTQVLGTPPPTSSASGGPSAKSSPHGGGPVEGGDGTSPPSSGGGADKGADCDEARAGDATSPGSPTSPGGPSLSPSSSSSAMVMKRRLMMPPPPPPPPAAMASMNSVGDGARRSRTGDVAGERMGTIGEDVGPFRSVEINSSYSHLPQKDIAGNSPLGSPAISRRNDINNLANSFHMDSVLQEQAFQQQILQLKKQQQLQQQILLQHFQAQQQQLAEQHEQQLRQQLKEFWEQKKQMEEERERREKERLEALKKKEKHEQSAVASTEVKQKLQGFLLSKKQREAEAAAAAAAANGPGGSSSNASSSSSTAGASGGASSSAAAAPGGPSPGYRNWSVLQGSSRSSAAAGGAATSGDGASSSSAGGPSASEGSASGGGPPGGERMESGSSAAPSSPSSSSAASTASSAAVAAVHQALLSKYDEDFPLRKTASEPNLLKVRLKQRVIERRCSPIVRRKERLLGNLKRRSQLATAAGGVQTTQPGNGTTPIMEEGGTSPYGGPLGAGNQGSISDLSLYSSPSMPNISLGRPPVPHSSAESMKLAPVSEAEVRAAFTARLGMPLTGQMMPGTIPFYPTLPVIEAEYSPTSPTYIHKQMQSLEQASRVPNLLPNIYQGVPPITDTQVAHARLHKQGHRPLGRTQSAPLPLGHPMLQGGGGPIPPHPLHPHVQNHHGHPLHPHAHHQLQQHALPHQLPSSAHPHPLSATSIPHMHHSQHPMGPPPPLSTASSSASSSPSSSHYEEYLYDRPQLQQHHGGPSTAAQQEAAHNFLKQQIRQTVLTRAGTRGQAAGQQSQLQTHQQHLDEAHEVEESVAEVIDLTERKGESEMAQQQRDREQFLQQQRDLMMRHTLQVSEGSAFTPRGTHMARPLSRALSSPLVALTGTCQPQEAVGNSTGKPVGGGNGRGTGVAFDGLMLKHQCICGDNSAHPEHGGRLQSIWARLQETGLAARCERLRSRKATLEELQSCHSETHTLLFGTNPLTRQKLDMSKLAQLPLKSFVALPCGGVGVDSDTTWNDQHTASAARMAVGCVIDLAFKAASGEIRNGFAVVRPPGHHAETSQAMGFCFFNSIAVAAKQLQLNFHLEKILIVDWDVHHGNGTQQMFYDDPRVLYLSIHRHDDGNFFPGTGGSTEVGVDDGVGFNVNVPWSGGISPPMGDAEYLAAFRSIVMPIAKDFAPEIVLVSAGFDAAAGHAAPLGGYKVSAACFGYMTQQLMQLAGGKVILSLEGGYDLPAICDASQECVRALLGDEIAPPREEELRRPPCQNAIDTLQKIIAIQTPHWPCIKRHAHTIGYSAIEAAQKEREEAETVTAMAGLSMQQRAAVAGSTVGSVNQGSAIRAANAPSPNSSSTGPVDSSSCDGPEEPMDQDEVK